MDRQNVFTIPPSVPFLDTLVGALLDGHLVQDFRPHGPFDLADVTLYLPTRRAARAIRETFLAKLGGPVLLPKIRTLGDLDEDEAGILDLESVGASARRSGDGAAAGADQAGAHLVGAPGAPGGGAAGRGIGRSIVTCRCGPPGV